MEGLTLPFLGKVFLFWLYWISFSSAHTCNKCYCSFPLQTVICTNVTAQEASASLEMFNMQWARSVILNNLRGEFDTSIITEQRFSNLVKLDLRGTCSFYFSTLHIPVFEMYLCGLFLSPDTCWPCGPLPMTLFKHRKVSNFLCVGITICFLSDINLQQVGRTPLRILYFCSWLNTKCLFSFWW